MSDNSIDEFRISSHFIGFNAKLVDDDTSYFFFDAVVRHDIYC